ncbi:MAG: hypothetical protein ACR2M6_01010 [Vampirovibrionia bacterium]
MANDGFAYTNERTCSARKRTQAVGGAHWRQGLTRESSVADR